ncbi:MAG: (2Fe-2S)-binding protein [Candidatus Schekmanbacteria bacterium]|nr:MAG: (2Fe-2S)-binding protein [Candidatus Schekmanbacteria bacterium]
MKKILQFTVNGEEVELLVDENETLLSVIREKLNLKGTKEGCGMGECGACTVLLNNIPVNSCLVLALSANGGEITTIEGLAKNGELDPIQEAFIENGAIQCGFCSPGMILMAKSLLEEYENPSDEDIKHYLAGNICRCTGYESIIRAIKDLIQKRKNN